ncbi:MAG: ATP-binding protein [Methanocellales archaeon]|nr:ATP-binding protein [Methanocellales archaeon]
MENPRRRHKMFNPAEQHKKFVVLEPYTDITDDIADKHGEEYKQTFLKVRSIIAHQQRELIKKGISGFLFHGEVGTGKTVMAKVLAKDLGIPLYFVDGSHIARALYGESEQMIGQIFEEATKQRSIILIDDAESVFPKRDWIKGQSWHVAQNNVFFHCLDNVDTSKTVVILTTNRYDMMDKAIIDRLYPIEFSALSTDTLIEIAKDMCARYKISDAEVVEEITKNKDKYKSMRAIEKLVTEHYIQEVSTEV